MTLYAAIDPAAPEPSRVLGFYDTDAIAYPSLPDNLVEMTPAEWDVRLARPYRQNGAFVPTPPPSPEMVMAGVLRDLAMELAIRQGGGVPFTLQTGTAIIVGTGPAALASNGHAGLTGFLLGADGTPYPVQPAEAAAALNMVAGYLQAVTRRYAELHAAVLADPSTDIKVGWPSSG